ncbi:MAG: putative amidohydrolase YtcJ [Gammaproteobacteria bacterium]|jgi:predicted amidohydrolase YtcJ
MGSLLPGMLADLVIFNGNLLDVPIENITELKPVFTLVGGRVAYESADL